MKSGWKWAAERAVTEAEARTPNKGHRRCAAKVVELAWVMSFIAGFPRRNQKAVVRWSLRKFTLSTKKGGQLRLLALLDSVRGLDGKRQKRENLAGQPLFTRSHCASPSPQIDI